MGSHSQGRGRTLPGITESSICFTDHGPVPLGSSCGVSGYLVRPKRLTA